MSAIAGPMREPALERHTVAQWRRGASAFLVFLAYALVDLVQHGSVPVIAVGFALTGAFVWLYLGPAPQAAFAGSTRQRGRVLAAMAAVVLAYLLLAGGGGIVFGVYLAVSVVMLLPPRASLPIVVALAVGVTFGSPLVSSWGLHGPQYGVGGPIVLVGVTMYSLRFNKRAREELAQAEAEVRHLAAGQERLRIARDLHDLLGHALTTVTLKAELAAQLAERDPARAAAEMREVAALAREGLADVRSTVAGYREVSLATELATAREVLAAAGIRAELPASTEEVPADLRPLFGWVVREGVTNAVRHSGARLVQVTVSGRGIEVADDGRGCGVGQAGSGLTGLTERAAAVGGTVAAGPGDAGGFRLRVAVPS